MIEKTPVVDRRLDVLRARGGELYPTVPRILVFPRPSCLLLPYKRILTTMDDVDKTAILRDKSVEQ